MNFLIIFHSLSKQKLVLLKLGSSYFRSTFSSQNNKNFRTDRGDAPSELAEFCANYAQFYSKTLKEQFYEP